MCEVREMTTEEKLHAEIKQLQKDLAEAREAVEHNRHVAKMEGLKKELFYRDGMIAAFKYALRCNGVSGGKIDRDS